MQGDAPASQTIYINNLNEKIKQPELKKSLNAVFSQFGKIMDIVSSKTLKLRGQAWVVFEELTAATNALRQMQDFPFYDKPMKIQYAKTKSDAVSKLDGTYVPKEKRKRHEEKAEKRKKDHHGDSHNAGSMHQNHYGNLMGSHFQPSKPEGPALPNSILFVQNLPHETSPLMLQMLFRQFPGFKEVRMVEAKPGIAFVEYGDELQATTALQALQGFKITPQYAMLITYAKK